MPDPASDTPEQPGNQEGRGNHGASLGADLDAALTNLSDPDLASLVQAHVAKRAGATTAARARVMMAAFLDENEQVGRLAGPPAHVIADLDADPNQTLLIRSTARRAILDETLLESAAVAQALGRTGRNDREAASTLRRTSRLIGLPQQSRYLYPAFQLDLAARRVHPVVADVNQVLDALHDPWAAASWWISPTPRLDDQAPRDLIDTDREDDLRILAPGPARQTTSDRAGTPG